MLIKSKDILEEDLKLEPITHGQAILYHHGDLWIRKITTCNLPAARTLDGEQNISIHVHILLKLQFIKLQVMGSKKEKNDISL